MREILFRGKHTSSGKWIISPSIRQEADGSVYLLVKRTWYQVDPETVGQYTGLTDKNGNKIFEGDIVEFLYNDFIIRGKVFYLESESAFVVYYELSEQRLFIHSKTLCNCNNAKVIGNIYDNPELLEVTE